MDKSFMHQSLQMLHCPQCGNLYTNSEVGVLQETENTILATITCTKCHYQSVVTLSLGNGLSASPFSDLRPAEIGKFMALEPVATDDLVEIHKFLKKTRGNFNEEFKAAGGTPATRSKPRHHPKS